LKDYQNHQNRVLTQTTDATKDLNPRDTVFLASEVSSDFESLLLQSRAALDRLTNFTSKHYGNDSSPIFSNVENTTNSKKEENTDTNLKTIDNANWFECKLIEDGLRNNLRSLEK
jgi:hypothetical protein